MSEVFNEVLQGMIDDSIAEARAVVPGKLDAVDAAEDGKLTVRFLPGIGRRVAGQEVADGPVSARPVMYPAGGGFSMVWPVAANDEVLGLAADRNTMRWVANREVGEAHSIDLPHDLSSVLVLPIAMAPPADAIAEAGTDWVLRGPEGEAIRVAASGPVTITRAGDPIATIELTADGACIITPVAGKTVDAGGDQPLALGQKVIDAVDAMLAAGIPTPNDGGAGLLSTMTGGWTGAKAAILASVTRGA